MTTSVTDDRARFEAWAKNSDELGDKSFRLDVLTGEYCSVYVYGAYIGWQAALRSQGKVVSVDALQGLCDEWENMKVPPSANGYELGVFDGYRGARRDLTAIIGEGG